MKSVIYQEQDFYIADKAPEVEFHNNQGNPGFFAQMENITGEKLYPVHRLDKVTSGLIILARNREAASRFGKIFETHQIEKTYLAIAEGKPKKKQGTISGDMERSRRGSWKLCRSMNNPAITRFSSTSLKPGFRLYWLKPQTGKTHQIRTAMKSLGTPILGDRLYGARHSDRVYLHAWKLEFQWEGRSLVFTQIPQNGIEFLSYDFTASINDSSEQGIEIKLL